MSSSQPNITIYGNAYFLAGASGEDLPGAACLYNESEMGDLGEIVLYKPEIVFNTSRTYPNGKKAPDGIEIRFGTNKPVEEVRQQLKDHGFRFSEKQTLWYAPDNAKSRKLLELWNDGQVLVDNARYEKMNFWVQVRSMAEYKSLRDRTEFLVKTTPPKFYYSKSFLERSSNVSDLIAEHLLLFKKFYNKLIDVTTEPGGEPQTDYDAIAAKLEKLAVSMTKEIERNLNSATSKMRQTARRVRIASSMRDQGKRLLDIQITLLVLANAYRNKSIDAYPLLKKITTKDQAGHITYYGVAQKGKWDIENLFKNFQHSLIEMGINSPEDWKLAFEQLKELPIPQQANQLDDADEKIKELERDLFMVDIPGYFPTPPKLIEQLLELAEIEDGHSILEPSAGKGDILDAITLKHQINPSELHFFEVNNQLREILKLKGYGDQGTNFLEADPGNAQYDRVIMNPPFENGQDVAHITHAIKILRPGGKLVAIASTGFSHRPFKKDKEFRELLSKMNAYVSPPISDAFKNATNPATAVIRIIGVNQDGSPFLSNRPNDVNQIHSPTEPVASSSPAPDIAILELEAEAEMELLKLRIEIERKRKQSGLGEIDKEKLQTLKTRAILQEYGAEVLDFK